MKKFLVAAVSGEKVGGLKRYAQAVLAGMAMTAGAAMAQTGGNDPTSTITTQLATYATDVAAIAAAVLLIVYGKKLVSYLRV